MAQVLLVQRQLSSQAALKVHVAHVAAQSGCCGEWGGRRIAVFMRPPNPWA